METLLGGRRGTAIAVAVIAALCVVVYGPSLGGGFLNWDDEKYVTSNPEMRLSFGAAVSTIFGTYLTGNWNPLQRLTYWIEWHAGGQSAFLFRLDSLLLHIAACVLVHGVLSEWLKNRGVALLAAAAFAVHPANVENVAWISERKSLLAAVFGFASVLVWMRAGDSTGRRVAALLLFAVGLLGKTSIVVLPVLLLVLDRAAGRALAWRWYAAFLAVAAPAAWVQTRAAADAGAIVPLHGGSPATHVATGIGVLPSYVGSVVAPFGLVPRHVFDPVTSFTDPRLVLGIAVAALIVWGVVRSWRGGGTFAVAGPWLLATLAPTLIVPIPIIHADRYLYLALPFVLGAAAHLVTTRLAATNSPLRWAPAAAVVALAAIAMPYASSWRTSTTLWTRQLERHPTDTQAWHFLAVARMFDGDRREARACFEQLFKLDPAFRLAKPQLAILDYEEGRFEQAATAMTAFVAEVKHDPTAWSVLVASLEALGRVDEAAAALEKGLASLPGDPSLAAVAKTFRANRAAERR